MNSFKDKVAVITGAASGIGAAIAKECITRKIKIILADIDSSKLNDLVKKLKQTSPDVVSLIADVSIKSDVSKLAKKVISSFGKVDLLFNNAGIAGPLGSIWEVDEKQLKKVINVNLMSIIYMLREFVPIMLKQKHEAYIVNTASGAGLLTTGLHTGAMSGYVTTKHAVAALSELLYFDLKKRKSNIHVSVLCPGLVCTNLAESVILSDNATKKLNASLKSFKTSLKSGMSPKVVVKKLFKGIQNNQLYILTHYNKHKALIQHRTDYILNKCMPKIQV